MYQLNLIVIVDWITFCGKAGYFWLKSRLLWVGPDMLQSGSRSAPIGKTVPVTAYFQGACSAMAS